MNSQGMAHGKAKPSGMLSHYLEPLIPFLRDNDLTEICINKPGEVWTEGSSGWRCHEIENIDLDQCQQIARLTASYNGKTLDEATPILSATFPTGERVQIVIPPAVKADTVSITIRKPSKIDKTLDELDHEGAFEEHLDANDFLTPVELQLLELKKNRKIKEFLDLAVKSHRNILIVGKTGSGKTTVTKSLIRSIPVEERLITIEDVHELFLNQHTNKVHLFYGRADERKTAVTSKQALASCLRMKPDRILLAELRGDESWEFIKSINTGHPGSISTMHANGAYEAFEQLTALIKDSNAGAHLDAAYVRHRLFTTLDIVLFYSNRKLREIYYDPELKRKQLA